MPLNITTIKVTLTPPADWTDEQFNAALKAYDELRLLRQVRELVETAVDSRTALDGVAVTVKDSADD